MLLNSSSALISLNLRYPSYLLFHLPLFPDMLLWNLTNDDKKGVNHQYPGRLVRGT